MNRNFRKFLALSLVLVTLFLTGCESLDYREAVRLYNAGSYAKAAEIFAQIPEYEDSAALVTRCHYWQAVQTMESGSFQQALEQFQQLGDYEDSVARILECRYQLALATFEENRFADAEDAFSQFPQYKQASEYLRRITWQKLFDAVAAAGTHKENGAVLERQQNGKVLRILANADPEPQLVFHISLTKDFGYVYYDDVTVTLTRDSMEGAFTAVSSFSLDFKGSQIGSTQQTSGKFPYAQCTPQMPLSPNSFEKTVTDNLGKTSVSNNPADSLMAESMAENFTELMQAVPEMLAEAGIVQTLQDIGFASY